MIVSLTALPSPVTRKRNVSVPSSCITAVPAYGIDGLASDDLSCWAAQVPAPHSMIATTIAVVFMIFVPGHAAYASFDIGPSPHAYDPSGVRVVILMQDCVRRGQAEWRRTQVQVPDLTKP